MPIGSQVSPHRALLKDFPACVKTMAGMGVTRLELCSPLGYSGEFAVLKDARAVKRIMKGHGVKCESAHFTLRELRQRQLESIAWAKEIGIKQMIVATLGDGNGGSTPTLDQVKKAAEEYNRIADVARNHGMQQGIDWVKTFRAGTIGGVKNYFVEQSMELTRESVAALKAMKV